MSDEARIKRLEKAMKRIYKAVEGLTNGEAVVQLETAKLDIMLNTGFVVLDGKTGLIKKKEEE